MPDDQIINKSNPFALSKWPPVSPQLVRTVDDWVMANVPVYNRGDTGDAALGVLAFHAGMRHVTTTLKLVQKSQEREIKRKAIHTTTQE